jgi:vitamin B12 transporter
MTELWRVTASAATAFKAPTLNDLFYPFVDYGFGYSYSGNPNLKPERSRNNEIGAHYANDGQRLDLVYFDNRIHDLIVINNLPAATTINLDEARIDGMELAYNGQFGDTGVKLAATQQNPHDAKTGQTLLRRAKNFSSAGVTQQFGALKVGGEWQHSGVRSDIDINTFNRTTLAAYDVVNFTAKYTLNKHFDLSARLDNLFNRDYMLAHGYNTLGRTLFVGLSYR